MLNYYRIYSLLFLFGFLCFSGVAQSYKTALGDSINPHFYIQAGSFFPIMNTTLRVDGKRGIGTELSLENDLKLKSEISAFRFSAMYRLKERSQFLFTYTSMNRSKMLSLDRDIHIGDTTFHASASLKVKFDVDYYALTYRYSFFNEANWNAGLSVGLRMVQFRTGFEATRQHSSSSYEESPVFVAPALLLGIHGSGYLTPRLLGRYSLEYFQVTFTGIKFNVLETQMSLSYYFTKNFGLGGGYANSAYNLNNFPLDSRLDGNVDFSFQGFTLFATARF